MRVLFVCTGNTCRSPMAEALFRARMPWPWRGRVEVSSAGTHAWGEQPASAAAVEALSHLGIDLSAHRSRRLTAALVEKADLVVAMAEEHAEAVLALDPDAERKLVRLGELDPDRKEIDIADPIGGDAAVYTASRDEMDRLVSLLIRFLADKFDI